MSHHIDLSRLVRRKPNLEVTCLRWDWKDSIGYYGSKTSWCHDTTHKFPSHHYGILKIINGTGGGDWKLVFGYGTDWSGTMYEGYGSDAHTLFHLPFHGTLDEAKRHAEIVYNTRVVPYLFKYGDYVEAMKLDLWINENANRS